MIKGIAILALCIFSGLFQLAAQNSYPVDELVFPCVKQPDDIIDCFQKGARAFIFDLETWSNKQFTEQQFSRLKTLCTENTNALVVLAFQGQSDHKAMVQKFSKLFGSQLYVKNEKEWPLSDKLISDKKNFILVFDDLLVNSSSEMIEPSSISAKRFSDSPLMRLVVYDPGKTDNLYGAALSLWTRTGRLPNLLMVVPDQLIYADQVASQLNKTRRIIGRVIINNEYLNNILWRQKKGLETPGCFSYPIFDYKEVLSPYKNGYKISPGEIIQNLAMKDEPRYFNAYESLPDDQLVMDFSFNGNEGNRLDPDWKGIISKDISFVDDPERGEVVCFSHCNSFIDYAKVNNLNVEWPLSIAMWVKPDSIKHFMGMIGLGTSFSLKLNMGLPDFTTANIRDHKAPDQLKINQWQHLVVVFDPNSVVSFYINGKKVAEDIASEIKSSDQSLIIGNNIWGEQFYGRLDELKIWNRGLSEQEINQLYLKSAHPGNRNKLHMGWYGIIALFVLAGGTIIFRKRKKSAMDPLPVFLTENKSIENQVRLFGSFSIISEKEGELSGRFSPLLKQMLAFFILNTVEYGQGIDIQQMSDTFWPGAPKEKAKENRNANLKKLRKALESFPQLALTYEDKKWSLQCDDSLLIDLWQFRKMYREINMQIDKQIICPELINNLLYLLRGGPLLINLDAEWLDQHKNIVSEQVVNLLFTIFDHSKGLSTSLQNDILRTILKFDDLNEQALKDIVKLLTQEGKHGQARQVFDEFSRKFSLLYQTDFSIDFHKIIQN